MHILIAFVSVYDLTHTRISRSPKYLELALLVGTPICSAVVPHVDPRHYVYEEERSPTRRPCPSSNGHPERRVSSVGSPLGTLYTAHLLWTIRPEKTNLSSSSMRLSETPHGVSACGCGAVPRHSPRRSSSFQSVALGDESTLSGANVDSAPEAELGCGDPASNSSFVRCVHRPSDSAHLL